MAEDRYAFVAGVLARWGWLLDFMLRRPRRRVVRVLGERGAASVLDACCGSGTLSAYLAGRGMAVTGIDASPSMLALARTRAPGVAFTKADLTQLETEAAFDGAVIGFALHEMPDALRQRVWAGMKRAVKPGGTLVVMDFAQAPRRGLGTRISWYFITADERTVDKHDPGHFANFQNFMEMGGAKGWLTAGGEVIAEERYFMWGNIGVFVVAA